VDSYCSLIYHRRCRSYHSENVVGGRAANGLLKANVFAGLIIRKMRGLRYQRLHIARSLGKTVPEKK